MYAPTLDYLEDDTHRAIERGLSKHPAYRDFYCHAADLVEWVHAQDRHTGDRLRSYETALDALDESFRREQRHHNAAVTAVLLSYLLDLCEALADYGYTPARLVEVAA